MSAIIPERRRNGFTIVELLIVIVIIGILAALVIVAYRGIQQRAENAKTISAIEAYKKALIQYAIEKNMYPPVADGRACFGEDNPAGKCNNGTIGEVTAFNTALRPYLGNSRLPMPSTNNIGGYNGGMFVDHTHPTVTLDGQQYRYYIWYTIAGSGAKCPIGPVLSGGWATFTSTDPASGYTSALTGGSQCWTKMPDPSML